MKSSDKEAYVKYRLKRAHESIQESEDLLRLGHELAAVSRLYYACFYAVNALLYQYEISNATTHTGVRRMLGLHFVESSKLNREATANKALRAPLGPLKGKSCARVEVKSR